MVVPPTKGLAVLGAPLGDPTWCAAQVEQQVHGLRPRFDAVHLASSEQVRRAGRCGPHSPA
jgi:hypothetical protein